MRMQIIGRLRTNQRQRASQLRRIIERLGPAYVKVAQVSTTNVSCAPIPACLCVVLLDPTADTRTGPELNPNPEADASGRRR